MSRFKKKAQRFTYSLEEAPKSIAPSFRPSTSRARKEEKKDDDSLLLNALKEELQKRLIQKVTGVLGENENVEVFKNTLLTDKRLERGAVTEAEKSHDCPSGYQYWVDHVNDLFDITLNQVQGQSTVHNFPKSASPELSNLATPESSVPAIPSHPKETSASQRNLEPLQLI
ncbi:hypothetical protein G6F42_012161 [Rhizopus arrhizus]|nr:hypothetical protein G6F42_012161 [Rhizopus arrhizus]